MKKLKSLVINIDSKCNAMCRHCCFSCSPTSKDFISDQEVEKILAYIKEHEDIKQVAITGGEAFLRYNTIKKIIYFSATLGKDVTLITNGFWAATQEKAKKILLELVSCGLKAVTISCDEFHAEFVKIESVRNLLFSLKDFDIDTAINMVVDRTHKSTKIIDELGESAFGIKITIIPASRVGMARTLPESDLYFYELKKEKLKCPAKSWEYVIHHDGYVYPCCSPSVFETMLRVGNIREDSFDEIEDSLLSNILLFIIQREGLSWFIDRLGINIEKMKFVSVCEICQYIFSNEKHIDDLYEDMMEYYESISTTI